MPHRCTKAAMFTSHQAAKRHARALDDHYGLPPGAFDAYPCDEHDGYFHAGRRNGFNRWLEWLDHRLDYLSTEAARVELGDRVIAWGRRENLGPPRRRYATILSHARTLRRKEPV